MKHQTVRWLTGFILILLAGCRQADLTDPAMQLPTDEPANRATAVPTATELPTSTAVPTATITPIPSATAPPEPTPDPHWWIGNEPMPAPRAETGAGLIDGRIYVPAGMTGFRYSGTDIAGILGTNSLAIYDIQTDTWTSGAVVPYEGLNHQATAVYDGKLYTFGGLGPEELLDTLVLVYNPATDSWQELPPMPETRQSATAVTLGDGIYIVGGAGSNAAALLRYRPDSGEWTVLAEMSQIRNHLAAVVLNGEIYAIGGREENPLSALIVDFDLVEIYNPETNTWRRGPSLNLPRAGFAAAAIDGKIYVAGGELLSHLPPDVEPSVEMFDPATNRWEVIDELPMPLHGVAGIGYEGKFYLVAGSNRPGSASPFSRVTVFTPGENQ
jgi:N-acetylneuraminic acid mutarotase